MQHHDIIASFFFYGRKTMRKLQIEDAEVMRIAIPAGDRT